MGKVNKALAIAVVISLIPVAVLAAGASSRGRVYGSFAQAWRSPSSFSSYREIFSPFESDEYRQCIDDMLPFGQRYQAREYLSQLRELKNSLESDPSGLMASETLTLLSSDASIIQSNVWGKVLPEGDGSSVFSRVSALIQTEVNHATNSFWNRLLAMVGLRKPQEAQKAVKEQIEMAPLLLELADQLDLIRDELASEYYRTLSSLTALVIRHDAHRLMGTEFTETTSSLDPPHSAIWAPEDSRSFEFEVVDLLGKPVPTKLKYVSEVISERLSKENVAATVTVSEHKITVVLPGPDVPDEFYKQMSRPLPYAGPSKVRIFIDNSKVIATEADMVKVEVQTEADQRVRLVITFGGEATSRLKTHTTASLGRRLVMEYKGDELLGLVLVRPVSTEIIASYGRGQAGLNAALNTANILASTGVLVLKPLTW